VLLSLEVEEAASQLLQAIGPQILRPWPVHGTAIFRYCRDSLQAKRKVIQRHAASGGDR
jgi:hypothetical protein